MSTVDFGALKDIDPKTDALVSGYFRDFETYLLSINDDNPYYNIARLLILLTISYYASSDEFDVNTRGLNMKLSGKTTISHTRQGWDGVFGKYVVSFGKYKWKLRVNKFYHGGGGHIVTGVINTKIADPMHFRSTCPSSNAEGCYGFDTSYGTIWNEGDLNTKFELMVTKAGDIIEIELDLEKNRLRCRVNGKDIGKKIWNLKDGDYRLSVHMYYEKTELELL